MWADGAIGKYGFTGKEACTKSTAGVSVETTESPHPTVPTYKTLESSYASVSRGKRRKFDFIPQSPPK